MATGEFHFVRDLLNLGGPLALEFRLYYGSGMDAKRSRDGLPPKFSANLRGTISRNPDGSERLAQVRDPLTNTWSFLCDNRGRLGCFCAGCCHGSPAFGVPWAVTFNHPASACIYKGIPVHPAQLYMVVVALVTLAALLWCSRRPAFRGALVWVYLACYGGMRFGVEFWRGDVRPMLGGLAVNQWVCLLFALVGGAMLAWRFTRVRAADARATAADARANASPASPHASKERRPWDDGDVPIRPREMAGPDSEEGAVPPAPTLKTAGFSAEVELRPPKSSPDRVAWPVAALGVVITAAALANRGLPIGGGLVALCCTMLPLLAPPRLALSGALALRRDGWRIALGLACAALLLPGFVLAAWVKLGLGAMFLHPTFAAGPDPATVGGRVHYELRVRNAADRPASGVVVTNWLPSGVNFLSATASQGNVAPSGGGVIAALGSLASGASATVRIVAQPTGVGPHTNAATVAAAEADLQPADNPAAVVTGAQEPTLFVTNTNDSGAGSLRQALLDANTNANVDVVAFNIPGGGVPVIAPGSTRAGALPVITSPVVLDGFTQPGGLGMVTNGAGTGGSVSITDTNTTRQRFKYRIQLQQP
jgi:uncharacterized repeat protein (TIGR01451 family)